MMQPHTATPTPASAGDLIEAGLLKVGHSCDIHPTALFLVHDLVSVARQIVLADHVSVGAFVIVHGGTHIGAGSRIGHHTIVGEPEYGYAMREVYVGAGSTTRLGSAVVVRSGAIVYAGVVIGDDSTIGHHTLLRTDVHVGTGCQLAANVTVERGTHIGDRVRVSPASHLTGAMTIGDGAYVGAGVRTINDKHLIWRDPEHEEPMTPPTFASGARIGTGSVILDGVTVGTNAVIGAGAVVTRDVEPNTKAYGVPAIQHGRTDR
ncbi:DapH/DapD/GlmU-related protein [Cryptosporangium sp. NPDC051539]|uniref:DapH/DapD/GlmU-related protein n=1 Tax=Cryptosporangium sp. NPDC051539 TaxID=3363962 RepID=UPI0037AB6758